MVMRIRISRNTGRGLRKRKKAPILLRILLLGVITQSGRGFRISWRLPTTADLREGFMSQEEAGRKHDFEGVYSINHNEMISPSLLVR